MDAHALYSRWKEYQRLPGVNAVVDFTVAGKTRELEFVAVLYTTTGKTLDISSALRDENLLPILLKQIPTTWNEKISAVMTIQSDILEQHADLRILVGRAASQGPVPTNAIEGVEALVQQMNQLSLAKSADEYMVGHSKRDLHTMADMIRAHVSMDWVKQCASTLQASTRTPVDEYEFVLLRSASDRHVHHVNGSVIAFLNALSASSKTENGFPQTVTWQFSQESKSAIHLTKFRNGAARLCPEHPMEFIVFACSIGIPIHELMKTRDIIQTWKSSRFKLFNQENIIKALLRRRFDSDATDIESNRLVRKYVENIDDFHVMEDAADIDQYFFKKFYSYPTADEIEHLANRITKNTHEWSRKR